MRRTGVRASVYWNFIIHQILPEFLQPFQDLRIQRVAPFYRGFLFIWFLDFIGLGFRLCSSGSSPAHHRPAFEAHPGANKFPPTTHCWPRDRALLWAHPLSATPAACYWPALGTPSPWPSGCPDLSSTELDTGTREISLLLPSSRSRI